MDKHIIAGIVFYKRISSFSFSLLSVSMQTNARINSPRPAPTTTSPPKKEKKKKTLFRQRRRSFKLKKQCRFHGSMTYNE